MLAERRVEGHRGVESASTAPYLPMSDTGSIQMLCISAFGP